MDTDTPQHASTLAPVGPGTNSFREEGGLETELKVQLGSDAEANLRREISGSPLREGPVRTRTLVTVYCDTPGFALAGAGIALRLRKIGRGWVQTVKMRPREGSRGLFAATEFERPAPGGKLHLEDGEMPSLMAEIRALAGGEAIAPVFETRVKRLTARLRTEQGMVEVALDRGEVIAGALAAPIREAEFELVDGEVGAIFEVARRLFPVGPLRFSQEPKSARGLRLAQTGRADLPRGPRHAGEAAYAAKASVEAAAQAVLRDCHAQVSDNLALAAESDDPEATHQLRVGLRRLRAAIVAFQDALGREAFVPVGELAQRIGREVGRLRDFDVLIGGIIARAAARGLDEELRADLVAALEPRREEIRAEVRQMLAGPEATGFVLDLGELIETAGWRGGKGERGGRMAKLAPEVLEARYRKVIKRGRRLDRRDTEALHDLRKAVKKLRYTVDLTMPLHGGKSRKRFLKALKRLQGRFGDVNDAATAEALLAEIGADPRVERAAGWVLGSLATEAGRVREDLIPAWEGFAALPPYWR